MTEYIFRGTIAQLYAVVDIFSNTVLHTLVLPTLSIEIKHGPTYPSPIYPFNREKTRSYIPQSYLPCQQRENTVIHTLVLPTLSTESIHGSIYSSSTNPVNREKTRSYIPQSYLPCQQRENMPQFYLPCQHRANTVLHTLVLLTLSTERKHGPTYPSPTYPVNLSLIHI